MVTSVVFVTLWYGQVQGRRPLTGQHPRRAVGARWACPTSTVRRADGAVRWWRGRPMAIEQKGGPGSRLLP